MCSYSGNKALSDIASDGQKTVTWKKSKGPYIWNLPSHVPILNFKPCAHLHSTLSCAAKQHAYYSKYTCLRLVTLWSNGRLCDESICYVKFFYSTSGFINTFEFEIIIKNQILPAMDRLSVLALLHENKMWAINQSLQFQDLRGWQPKSNKTLLKSGNCWLTWVIWTKN